MPSSYAHYRFGTEVLPAMPADIRGTVQRYRALFDMGLHGPDIFFFHNLLKMTPVCRLGTAYHEQSGTQFFTGICARLRNAPSDVALAYLYGVLVHYCLDSTCHPFVYHMTDDGPIGHAELETEFDRYLLALDGCKTPFAYNMGKHMKLTGAQCSVAAAFYPEVPAEDVHRCIRNMVTAERLLSLPTGAGHRLVETVTRLVGGNSTGKVMTVAPNPSCAHLNEDMLDLYRQALARFPEYLEQLNAHLAYGAPFGEAFSANFNRG